MSPHDCLGPISLYDPESTNCLGVGQAEPGSAFDGFPFQCLQGNGTLLKYYFARGKRSVVVRSGENEGFTARLCTRWSAGRREWTLESEPADA